jgi:hypothetical protein
MALALVELPTIGVGDVELFAIDYTEILDTGEALSSGTATEVTTTALTITNVAVNSDTLVINGVNVNIGRALSFKVSGQVINTTYTILVTVITNSSPARTLARHAKFRVE